MESSLFAFPVFNPQCRNGIGCVLPLVDDLGVPWKNCNIDTCNIYEALAHAPLRRRAGRNGIVFDRRDRFTRFVHIHSSIHHYSANVFSAECIYERLYIYRIPRHIGNVVRSIRSADFSGRSRRAGNEFDVFLFALRCSSGICIDGNIVIVCYEYHFAGNTRCVYCEAIETV